MKQKGITLLALIVTVIILLILVGVTIGQITGNEGLFNRVRKTVAQYENTQEKEDSGISELETMLAEERENQEELESTTADPEDVLKGETFYTGDKELLEGTMENNGAVTERVEAGKSYTIPKGYHNGLGTVIAKTLAEQTPGDAQAGDILSGKTAWVNGELVTGKMPNNPSEVIELKSGEEYTIPWGYHDGTGKIKVANLLQLVEKTYKIPNMSWGRTLSFDIGESGTPSMITNLTIQGGNTGSSASETAMAIIQASDTADSGYVQIGQTNSITVNAGVNSAYICNNATFPLISTKAYRYYMIAISTTDPNGRYNITNGNLVYRIEDDT